MNRPDPRAEIRLLGIRPVPGANFWSRRAVTRVDLAVGAYDEISSAEVPGFTEALVAALPGLEEHRCSIGERGGFVVRLQRGTYAPHIIEHVALELQSMIGHEVGFGRARGGDREGEYTVVVAHRHEAVGEGALRAAAALVNAALAGEALDVGPHLETLRELAGGPVAPPLREVVCGAVDTSSAEALHRELARHGVHEGVRSQTPREVLERGLAYSAARVAVITGASAGDVPPRYRDAEATARLLAVVADAVGAGGVVVLPAGADELRQRVLEAGCRAALFGTDGDLARASEGSAATARIGPKSIVLSAPGGDREEVPIHPDAPAALQAAAALAARSLHPSPASRPLRPCAPRPDHART